MPPTDLRQEKARLKERNETQTGMTKTRVTMEAKVERQAEGEGLTQAISAAPQQLVRWNRAAFRVRRAASARGH